MIKAPNDKTQFNDMRKAWNERKNIENKRLQSTMRCLKRNPRKMTVHFCTVKLVKNFQFLFNLTNLKFHNSLGNYVSGSCPY
jgi:hypothetical protein